MQGKTLIQFFLFLSFSILLAHNTIPHHHHDEAEHHSHELTIDEEEKENSLHNIFSHFIHVEDLYTATVVKHVLNQNGVELIPANFCLPSHHLFTGAYCIEIIQPPPDIPADDFHFVSSHGLRAPPFLA